MYYRDFLTIYRELQDLGYPGNTPLIDVLEDLRKIYEKQQTQKEMRGVKKSTRQKRLSVDKIADIEGWMQY